MNFRYVQIGTLVVFFGFLLPKDVFAQNVNVALEIPFGQTAAVLGLADYLAKLYTFIVTTIGIIATVMIMFHGIQWAAAAGNSDVIGKAKDGILHAIIGVVLAFSSYLILYTINPALTQFTDVVLPDPKVNVKNDIHANTSTCTKNCEVTLTRPSGESVIIKSCQESDMVSVNAFNTTIQVHKEVAESLKRIDQEWQKKGGNNFYQIPKSTNSKAAMGGYNCRPPSYHAFGLAVDINPWENDHCYLYKNDPTKISCKLTGLKSMDFQQYIASRNNYTDMPPEFVQLWKNEGWGWGGDWINSKDPMHFSKVKGNEGGDGKTDK